MNKALGKYKDELEKTDQPGFKTPMKATLTHEHFSDPEWIYERKLDGERCLLHKKSGEVTLFSRNRKNKNSAYPEIADALEKLPGDFILDAEIVTFEGDVSSFSKLQHRIHVKSPDDKLKQEVPVYAYIFDIIYLDGYDLTGLPLRERKSILKNAFDYKDPLRYLPHRNEEGEKYLEEACGKGWEGLIAKDASSNYIHKRAKSWLKFKCGHGQELVIGGYTEPKGSRVGFGALLLGYYEGGDLKYAGRVGTGFNDEFLESLYRRMAQMKRRTCPFKGFDEKTGDITWIEPRLVGEIGFTEWTSEGKLRHPRFLGLRDDKKAEGVIREDKAA